MTDLRLKVLQIIQDRSNLNPIMGKDIIRILDLKEDEIKFGAKLRQIVNGLRQEGYPICATGKGYYYPQSCLEMKKYLESFKSRIDCQLEAYNGMVATYDKAHAEWIMRQQAQLLAQTKIMSVQAALI